MILSMPSTGCTALEIDKLKTQLSKKGKIIMMDLLVEAPPASTFFLDSLSDGHLGTGIGFVWGLVTDTVNNLGGNKLMIPSDNFAAHSISSSLSQKIAMMNSAKLTVETMLLL